MMRLYRLWAYARYKYRYYTIFIRERECAEPLCDIEIYIFIYILASGPKRLFMIMKFN